MKSKRPPLEFRCCAHCGRQFGVTSRKPNQRFCSQHCHYAALHKKSQEQWGTATCETCGIVFQRSNSGGLNRFCSRECAYGNGDIRSKFEALINKNGPTQTHMSTPCWIWNAPTRQAHARHGRIHVRERGLVLTHRLSYEIYVGPIPNGLVVRHKCDVPRCVNPDHLELGTKRDNSADMVRRNRTKSTPRPGVLNPNALLTDEMVRAIRAEYEEGCSYRTLSERFGFGYATIWDVINRRSWRHVA